MITLRTRADFEALPPHQREAVMKQIRAARARHDPAEWCRQGPHTQYGPMSPHRWQLEAWRQIYPILTSPNDAGTIRVVLLDTMQQVGKTELMKRTVAHLMAEHGQSVGLICYDWDKLAKEHSRAIRRLLRSPEALEIWPHLARKRPAGVGDSDALNSWTIPHREPSRPPARLMAAGRDAGLEGQPLDGVVFDDVFKSVEDCASAASQRSVDDLIRSSALGRVSQRGGWILDIGTRRGANDTKGWWRRVARELEAAGLTLDLHHISFPIRGPEPWRYGDRGYLMPNHTEEWEAVTRATMGRLAPILLDQEDPAELGGLYTAGCLDHTYPDTPWVAAKGCDNTYLAVDTAQTAGGGDFTVIQWWGVKGAKSLLLYQWRGQWDDLEVIEQIRSAIHRTRPTMTLIEKTPGSSTGILTLKKSIPGIKPITVAGQGPKRDRIQGTVGLWALGDVLTPEPGPETGWFYEQDENGRDWRGRLYALRGDRPDMTGELDDEADAATLFLRWRLSGARGTVRAHRGFSGI